MDVLAPKHAVVKNSDFVDKLIILTTKMKTVKTFMY